MSAESASRLPVAVIGAGPVGLAAAAHLVRRGLPVALFEAGSTVAANLRGYRRRDLTELFGGGANDGLPARGALGARLQELVGQGRLELRQGFRIRQLVGTPAGLTIVPEDDGMQGIDGVDRIIGATGARPDLGITSELRTRHDPWLESTDQLAPLIDPNEHSCGTVRPHGHRELAHPEPGFYAIGAKSYGRAPNFLMATGYEQARSVVAALAGDTKAADQVQLELPQTGVCSTSLPGDEADDSAGPSAGGCCGGPATNDVSACCALDEKKKAAGEAGCGCSR